MMIAAECSGVTISHHILKGAGMIQAKRGRIIILDRENSQSLLEIFTVFLRISTAALSLRLVVARARQ
jgi:hypothetical protein